MSHDVKVILALKDIQIQEQQLYLINLISRTSSTRSIAHANGWRTVTNRKRLYNDLSIVQVSLSLRACKRLYLLVKQ